MQDEQTITLELDRRDAETFQSMVGIVLEHGDGPQKRAASELGNKFAAAMLKQIPGLREGALEQIEELVEAGAPEELVTQLKAAIEEDAALSEEEIDGADIDGTLDQILRESDPPEAS
jgi:hypothetical protein